MKVLVLAAHPDDETIGLGGTIAKHVEAGDKVYGKFFTNGLTARSNQSKEIINERFEAALKASDIIGLDWIQHSNFPDNKLDTVPLLEIVKVIENLKKEINPKIIYTHSAADLNIDHRIITEAALTAFRPQAGEIYEEIRLYEVQSATDYSHPKITKAFEPNLFIDISETFDKKIDALLEYKDELKKIPNSRSIEGIKNLAKYRGFQVGIKYAEAFEVVRRIIR